MISTYFEQLLKNVHVTNKKCFLAFFQLFLVTGKLSKKINVFLKEKAYHLRLEKQLPKHIPSTK